MVFKFGCVYPKFDKTLSGLFVHICQNLGEITFLDVPLPLRWSMKCKSRWESGPMSPRMQILTNLVFELRKFVIPRQIRSPNQRKIFFEVSENNSAALNLHSEFKPDFQIFEK